MADIVGRALDLGLAAEGTLSNPGICMACGEEFEGVEPDAEEYPCEACGEAQVYGAVQAVLLFGF